MFLSQSNPNRIESSQAPLARPSHRTRKDLPPLEAGASTICRVHSCNTPWASVLTWATDELFEEGLTVARNAPIRATRSLSAGDGGTGVGIGAGLEESSDVSSSQSARGSATLLR